PSTPSRSLPSLTLSVAHHYLHSFPTRRSSDLRRTREETQPRARPARVDPRLRPQRGAGLGVPVVRARRRRGPTDRDRKRGARGRSEEHTSELQSPYDLVCRLLLEKKKPRDIRH